MEALSEFLIMPVKYFRAEHCEELILFFAIAFVHDKRADQIEWISTIPKGSQGV